MYAQLCLKLNEFAPNFEEKGNQTTTFRKLLLHKCHEEFEKRKKANAVLENGDTLSAEEKEQNTITKWKMLGNIKFVGELFKLDMLHEKIIHSCVKELLEKKRLQSQEDICKSLECLCYFLTTVGVKLDTEKAKGWMDAYFERIESLCGIKDIPPRIRFMLQDLVELRTNKWVPRRSHPELSPQPIYKIRQGAMDPSSQAHLRRSPSNTSSPQHNGSYPYPGAPLPHDFGPHPPHDIGPYLPHESGPHHFPPHGPHSVYCGVPPPFINASGPHPPHLIGPSPQLQQLTGALPPLQHFRSGDIPPIQTSPSFTPGPSSPSPDRQPAPDKMNEKGKRHRKAPVSAESVSLRPSVAFKPGAKLRPSPKSSPPLEHAKTTSSPSSAVHVPPPRTRDDSSDEDDHRKLPGSTVPQASSVPSGPPPFHSVQYHPVPHFSYSPHRFPGMPPPGPMHYGPPGPPPQSGLPLMGPPHPSMSPYLMPHHHPQYPLHDSFPRGAPYQPPPGPLYSDGHPSRGPLYPVPRVPPMFGGPVPPWVDPAVHGTDRPEWPEQASSRGDKAGSPSPNMKGTTRADGSKIEVSKKAIIEETEQIVTSALERFLKTIDFQAAINELKGESINKSHACVLLLTRTLEKSEDERTHVSTLLKKLAQASIVTSSNLHEAFKDVMASVADYVSIVPQAKVYLAGFMARAISMGLLTMVEAFSTFDPVENHPMVLVVLQALNSLLGETLLLQKFQESGLKIAALLPIALRSYTSIIELLDAKGIGFLYPLRKTQSELSASLKRDPLPSSVYKWIKANVPTSLHSNPDFIMLLTRCVLDHVTLGNTLPVADTAQQPSKEQISKEKESLSSLKVVIQKFVIENTSLQVNVLYATQVFCYDNNFPKGLMQRLFCYWYDLDVVDEDAFFKWREDISQEYPGKEKALFQVNPWLVWLSEADEESDEDKQ